MFCPNHPKQSPTKMKVIFNKVTRRFDNYQAAHQFLTGLRFQDGSGQLDSRDYQIKTKPLAFDHLVEEWLEVKKGNMRPGGWSSIKALMRHAANAWGSANVKSINYAQVEDLLNALPPGQENKA